jgi:asparagine synthase (glutamine-hydrolysing)
MCGLTGFLASKNFGPECENHLSRMADAIRHRGPNDQGIWLDRDARIGLAHRRLSILDLSPQGHQPMVSARERYVIVFNGEVYNFKDLRRELDSLGESCGSGSSATWRGHSDTEVILAAIEQWGLEKAVKRFIGMFAFALWDKKERVLHLVRDRLGIKPLYYGWQGNSFLFGSELKALKAHPDFKGQVDRNALALLLRHNYIPAPHSIFEGIHKLLPGHILTLNAENPNRLPNSVPYWSAEEMAEKMANDPFKGSEEEAISQLDFILRDAVKMRMISDVPLGAFLSGGIDSSIVVALMQAQSDRPVKTFSIGFFEDQYNEAQHAKSVAEHLGTDHTELYVTPQQAMAVIPRLPTLYDEPFSDSSQIPTFLVSELARQKVTVSLSGDGGDELFGGYSRYSAFQDLWKMIGWMPTKMQRVFAKIITSIPLETYNKNFKWLSPIFSKYGNTRPVGDKMYKLSEVLAPGSAKALYTRLISHWKEPDSIVIGASEYPTPFTDGTFWENNSDFLQKMTFIDTITYLPDDILAKVDRASMGVSLEARVPLLDHRVVEFAWQVPKKMKIKNGKNKWLLQQLLYKYVPQKLIDRPKMGFGVPIDFWLRGSMREWAEELLSEKKLREGGFFNPAPVREKWTEHLSGKLDWHYYLWDVLMFQAWLEEN